MMPLTAAQVGGLRDLPQALVLLVGGVSPIVMGILQPLGLNPGTALDVRGDGKRVEVHAPEELVLRCGEASLTLRKNGRVALKGDYVETYAKGVNRIKGGSVSIN